MLNEKRWPVTFSDVVTHIVDIRATSLMGSLQLQAAAKASDFFVFQTIKVSYMSQPLLLLIIMSF